MPNCYKKLKKYFILVSKYTFMFFIFGELHCFYKGFSPFISVSTSLYLSSNLATTDYCD